MRILHVTNYFQPQLGHQEYYLAKEHIKMGHNVAVITSDRYAPYVDYENTYGKLLGKRIRGAGYSIEKGVPVYRLPVLFEIKWSVWMMGLEKTIIDFKPDLVIAHSIVSNTFRIAKLKAKGYNFNLIVDDHMWWGNMSHSFISRLFYASRRPLIKRNLLPWVDKFVGVARAICDLLAEVNGIPKKKIKYIPLGVDSDIFVFNEEGRKKIRHDLNIGEKDILLLYTGKIDKSKGVDVIMKAFNLLADNNHIYLLLLSEGSKIIKKQLIDFVKEENRKKVIFHSFVAAKELANFYSASDICVWNTATVSFYEAMSCARPIIFRDTPALSERIENNNGFVYNPDDYEDLAKKIKYLFENTKDRLEMGKKGRGLIEKKYSWNRIAKQFIDSVNEA